MWIKQSTPKPEQFVYKMLNVFLEIEKLKQSWKNIPNGVVFWVN